MCVFGELSESRDNTAEGECHNDRDSWWGRGGDESTEVFGTWDGNGCADIKDWDVKK